mgnify:CR=1 FL=1
MPTSKLVALTKRQDPDGSHHFWEGKYGKFYDFTIEFENGDKGEISFKKSDQTYPAGKMYSYEKEEKNSRIKISKLVPLDENGQPTQSGGRPSYQTGPKTPMHWDKPDVVRSVTKNVCMEVTNNFISNMAEEKRKELEPEKIVAVADYFYSWCYGSTNETPDIPNWAKPIIERRECLQRAMEQIKIPCFQMVQTTDIVKRAQEIYDWILTPHRIHQRPETPVPNV